MCSVVCVCLKARLEKGLTPRIKAAKTHNLRLLRATHLPFAK